MVAGLAVAGLLLLPKQVRAEGGDFSLQVTPSPLVTTLKPGQTTTLELKIRNTGTQSENLKIEPRDFSIDDSTGELTFDDITKPDIAGWMTFSAPTFTTMPGQWYTEKVTFSVPKDAGFSYSFAFVVSRQAASPSGNGSQLKGSVAIFSLITIDKPGAKRELQIKNFKASQSVYEYLPVELTIELKNTGNTITQPSGTVFMQRGSNDTTPLGTLPVNKGGGYILPGKARKLTVQWDDGFQVLRPATDSSEKEQLTWNWSSLSHLRIGRYTAKLVTIYNDGQRDVPLVSEVSFWVFPWKLLLGVAVVIGLILVGLWTLIRKGMGLSKRKKRVRF